MTVVQDTTVDLRPGVLSMPAHWPLYAVLFASTSIIVGALWDISWHQTIGRDTFWTPAHLAIYLGGLVAGLTCGYLALRITFAGSEQERAETVRFWGFRAPLGAWVCIWGAFAMLTSAPFDDWWHNAYGLDVKILSPPHALLAAGVGAIQIGAMLMAVAWQNRAFSTARGDFSSPHVLREAPEGSAAKPRRRAHAGGGGAPPANDKVRPHTRVALTRLYLYSAGLLLLQGAVMGTEYLQRWDMHQSLFYQVACGVFPFFLVSAARASRARWPATAAALVYSGVTMGMMWILPLFEGRPLLGPIYVQVDRFIPPDFPLLLVVPALAIDVVMRRIGKGRQWRLSAALAVVFLVSFLAAQWPFAGFLSTPWARNWVFATHYMAYMIPPEIQQRWYRLNPSDNLAAGLPIALALAFVSARAGLWWGSWMSRVQR